MIDRKEFFAKKYDAMIANNEASGKVFENVRRKLIEEMVLEGMNKWIDNENREFKRMCANVSTSFGL